MYGLSNGMNNNWTVCTDFLTGIDVGQHALNLCNDRQNATFWGVGSCGRDMWPPNLN